MESNFSVLKANSRLTRSHSVHWWLSHQRPVRMGLSKVQPPSINTVQPIQVYNIYSLSLQLDNRGRSSHSWILVCLKRWVRPHMPLSHRLNELATDNNRSGMGSPGWCMSQWSTSTFWNSCGWTALDTPEWRKWPSRQTGGQSTPNKWVASWKIWTVERSLRHYLQAKKKPRASSHQSPGGERHEMKKCTMIFLEMMSEGHYQSDKHCHWNCFKASIWETSEAHIYNMVFFQALRVRHHLKLNWHTLNICLYHISQVSTVDPVNQTKI